MRNIMNAEQLIEAAGGRKRVMELTGLSRQSMCSWCSQNYIPRAWVNFLRLKFPEIRKAQLHLAPTYQKKQALPVQNSSAT
jgi:hypothetical protein